jgi:hypothetical protein
VQGRLRDQALTVDIETECGHCARPLHLAVDSELRFRVHDDGAEPLAFSPQVNWPTFEEPNITHAF